MGLIWASRPFTPLGGLVPCVNGACIPDSGRRAVLSTFPICVAHTRPSMCASPPVTSAVQMSRSGGAPGTRSAWETPPPARLPRRMVLRGGFIVTDDQQFRLHDRARLLGFADRGLLRSLQPRLCGETDGMSTCRSRPVPPTPSAFASFRFPPNVIVLAVATEGYRLIQDESP